MSSVPTTHRKATLSSLGLAAGLMLATTSAFGAGTVTLKTFDLPPGATVTLEFQATVSASPTGSPACNQGQVRDDHVDTNITTVPTDDPDTGAPADATCTPLQLLADLSITKTDGSTTEVPGTAVTYTIVAANAGPSAVTDAVVADTFPAILSGCTWTASVTAGSASGFDAAGAGNINDTGISIGVGGQITYSVTCNIDPSATGSLANTAMISSALTTDPAPANNSATDTDTLTPSTDVSVTKTDGATTEVPGTSVSYTIVASNAGPSTATGVTVADTFPGILSGCSTTSLAAGGATGNDAGPTAGNINDSGITLPPSATVTYTATCTIATDATGSLANTATIVSTTTDPTPGNNSATDTDTLTPSADVAITKTDSAASEVPGTPVTYTIVASNSGPSVATSVTVADTFPGILSGCSTTSVAAGSATGNDAGPTAGNINDGGITLPVGGSVTYTATCNIDPAATGNLANTATVSSAVTDPNNGNNSATDTDTLTVQNDVSITKTDGAASEVPGTPVTYTIVVANSTGPSTATAVSVADTFPASLTGCSVTSVAANGATGNDPGPTAGNISDGGITLPTGSSVTYTTTCNIDPAATGSLANTATATVGGGGDTNAGNNSATDTDTLAPSADVAISKTDGVGTVSPGGSTVYTIIASNSGPSTATSVAIADTFPATLLNCSTTSVAAGGATGNDAGPIAGNINDGGITLPPSATVTYTAACDIDGAAVGTIANTATITSATTDPNTGNNSATDTNDTLPLDYGDAPTAAQSGFASSYPTLLANDGARHGTLTGATLGVERDDETNGQPTLGADGDDLAPGNPEPDDEDGVSFGSAFVACEVTTATVNASAVGVLNAWVDFNRNGSWADPGEQVATDVAMSAGANLVPITTPCGAALGTSYARFRLASAGGLAPTGQAPDGEVEDYQITLTASANLAISKTDGVTSAVPGTGLIYTIVASNNGPSPVAGVSVADTFPGVLSCGWTSVAAGSATGNTNNGGPANLADTLSMPVGSSVTYTVSCTIAASATGTLSNTATIAATLPNTSDPVPGNNSATDNNTVLTPQVNLAITKTDGATSEVPGTPVTYTITVTNPGPSTDPNVTVADTFAGILSGCSTTSIAAGGAVGNDAGPFAGNINDGGIGMPPGSSVTYTSTCTIAQNATGSLANTATVTASVTDTDGANNSATDTNTLAPEADVSITKTDGSATEVPGTAVTYTIVVSNAGPSTDPNVTVADTFAGSLSGCSTTSVAAGGATGNEAGPFAGNINDTNIAMPSGSSVTYTSTCNIAAGATGSLVNTATATASVTDPTPANNSATDTNTLTPQVDVSITKTDGAVTEIPGTPVVYTIVVSNAGPSTDPAVAVGDTFPGALTSCGWTSVAANGATGNTNNPGPAAAIADSVAMPPASSVTYTLSCTVDAAATGSLSNTATANASVLDTNDTNDSATDTDTLTPETDLEIVKTADLPVVLGDEVLTYTLTVTNHGPSAATGVVITDNLPAEVTLTSTSGCTEDPNGIPTCTIGNLGVNATVAVDVVVQVDAPPLPPSFDNTATVAGNETDPVGTNNSSTVTLSTDQTPPEVVGVETAAGAIAGCGPNLRTTVNAVAFVFTEAMADSGGGPVAPEDADNPANYRLFGTGADFDFDNNSCGAPAGGDTAIVVDAVTYSEDTPAAPQSTATLDVNGGSGLADGLYRLIACSTLEDRAANQLDGDPVVVGTEDFVVDFRVDDGNLFANGHFDCDDTVTALNPWALTPPAAVEISRDTIDSDGAGLSGSLLIASTGGTGFGFDQCVEVPVVSNPYGLDGLVQVDTTPTALLGLNVDCVAFPLAACTGTSLGTTSAGSLLADTADAWNIWELTSGLVLPPGTASVRCGISLDNPLAASFEAWFDQLTLTGGGLIFADGFETGDTSAWTATVP